MFLSLSMGIELRRCVSLDVGFCVGWSSSQRLFVRPEVTLPLNVTPIKCHSVLSRFIRCSDWVKGEYSDDQCLKYTRMDGWFWLLWNWFMRKGTPSLVSQPPKISLVVVFASACRRHLLDRQMLLLLEPAVECEARLLSPKVGRRSVLERGGICATALLLSLQVYKRKPIVDGSRAQLDDGHNHLLLLQWHCGAVGLGLGGMIVSTANPSLND